MDSFEPQPPAILAPAATTAEPSSIGPPHQAPAVRAALIIPPAEEDADGQDDRSAAEDGRRKREHTVHRFMLGDRSDGVKEKPV